MNERKEQSKTQTPNNSREVKSFPLIVVALWFKQVTHLGDLFVSSLKMKIR